MRRERIMFVHTYSHVRGVCVTNNNRFWIGLSDLLLPSLQLQPIITAHNDCLRLAPFLTGLRVSSLPLWMTWFWLTNRSRLLRLPWTTTVLRIELRLNCSCLHGSLYSLSVTMENVYCLAVVMETCLPKRCLSMYFHSGSTIPAFGRHVTIHTYIHTHICTHNNNNNNNRDIKYYQGENSWLPIRQHACKQVFNRVGPDYEGLTNFIIIDQYFGFPGEGYNFNFTDAEFHAVGSAPTLYTVNVRL
jgi:hypothetical protein